MEIRNRHIDINFDNVILFISVVTHDFNVDSFSGLSILYCSFDFISIVYLNLLKKNLSSNRVSKIHILALFVKVPHI